MARRERSRAPARASLPNSTDDRLSRSLEGIQTMKSTTTTPSSDSSEHFTWRRIPPESSSIVPNREFCREFRYTGYSRCVSRLVLLRLSDHPVKRLDLPVDLAVAGNLYRGRWRGWAIPFPGSRTRSQRRLPSPRFAAGGPRRTDQGVKAISALQGDVCTWMGLS